MEVNLRFPISTRKDWMHCDCLRFTARFPTNVSLGVRCRQVSLEFCVGPVRCLIIFGQGLLSEAFPEFEPCWWGRDFIQSIRRDSSNVRLSQRVECWEVAPDPQWLCQPPPRGRRQPPLWQTHTQTWQRPGPHVFSCSARLLSFSGQPDLWRSVLNKFRPCSIE